MRERVIWAIGGVKFKKKNGQMVIPPDDPQYKKVEFVNGVLKSFGIPYKKEWAVSKKSKNILLYRFVVNEFAEKPVTTDDIRVVQSFLGRFPQ